MNILVTGGAGYIGSVTTEMLIENGHNVIVVDDLRDGNRQAVHSDATLYEVDFSKDSILNIMRHHKIELVVHFAASANIPISMRDPAGAFENNVANSMKLLDMMRLAGCNNIIVSSSSAVYGNPKYTPIDENHPTEPVNPYGESKLMTDKILYWYHKAYNVKTNIFRYFCAAGATKNCGEARKDEDHLIPLAIETVLGKREKLFVLGNDYPTKDGTCVRDFIHVVDIARAHVLAIDNLERRPFEIYNLGTGNGYTVMETIRTVEKVSGTPVNFEITGRRSGDPYALVANYEKAKKELGWMPEYGLEEMVRSALEWQMFGKEKMLKKLR